MENKYDIMERYRIALDETWMVFGARIEGDTGVSWQTLYKVINGKTNPNARTRHKLDTWLNLNLSKIYETIYTEAANAHS